MTPKHYQLYPEPMEVIQNWGLPFALGNVIKYVARAGKKSSNSATDDLIKAADYLVRHIAFESKIGEKPFCIEFYPEPAVGVLDDWPESENSFYPLNRSDVIDEYREEIRKFIEYEREGTENMNFDGSPIGGIYLDYRDWAYRDGIVNSRLAPLPQRAFIKLFKEEANVEMVFRTRKVASKDERD